MSRYIDIDKAIPIVIDAVADIAGGITQIDAVNIVAKLEEIPIENVVEVRHGEWISKCIAISSGGFEWYMHTCSNCGDFYKTVLPNGYKYCHNCGAKMDGERSENGTH